MNKFKIAWLFPDTLYLHGERGNLLALQRIASFAGLTAEIHKVDFDTENFDVDGYDLIFCPPGEVSSFPQIVEWLKPYSERLEAFVKDGKILLVTGTSVALWTKEILRADGSKLDGIGLLNVETVEREEVYGDDNYFSCKYNGKEIEIIGNQIQMVDFENKGEEPFGYLKYGFGNNGKNREEGYIKNNSIFTNTLAPMLVANPKLTKELVLVIAQNKGYDIDESEFNVDMEIEDMSFETKKEFILTKVTRLTNCK